LSDLCWNLIHTKSACKTPLIFCCWGDKIARRQT
jgi:hypothetical protein